MSVKPIEEKSIMPAKKISHSIYPLENLAVSKKNEAGQFEGPSILVGTYTEGLMKSVNQVIWKYKNAHPGTNFSQRHCPDGNIRIWRTA